MLDVAYQSKITRWLRNVSIGIVVCLLVAVFMTTQWYFTPDNEDNSAHWPVVFKHFLFASYTWGVLTFAIQPTVAWLGFNRMKWVRSLAIYVLVGLAFSFGYIVLGAVFFRIIEFAKTGTIRPIQLSAPQLVGLLQSNLPVFLLIASLFLAVNYWQKYQLRELQASQLKTQLAAARLDALKSQLQPHFLFNTLNSITALIKDNPQIAERMIVWLSDLLRSTLDSQDQNEVRLGEELKSLTRYLEIQKIRFGDRLEIEMRVDPSVENTLVPILLLQPLVENAIHHGVMKQSVPCRVAVVAKQIGTMLQLSISNTASTDLAGSDRSKDGIGLRNTEERLRHLYGDRFRFHKEMNHHGEFCVSIQLPCRTSGSSEHA